jgi:hypothetical protein
MGKAVESQAGLPNILLTESEQKAAREETTAKPIPQATGRTLSSEPLLVNRLYE